MEKFDAASYYNCEIDGDVITQWRIYRCLQALTIPCQYSAAGVIQVKIRSSQDDRHLQQIIDHVTAHHPAKVQFLEACLNHFHL